MLLDYCVANPAGNITVLVTSPVEKRDYALTSRKLMARIDHAEQVGFLREPVMGGDVRLEMMGGEFCGNALRSAAYYYVRKNIPRQWSLVATEISGCDRVLAVSADVLNGKSQAEMVLPRSMEKIESWDGSGAMAFLFDGIVHIVVVRKPQRFPDEPLKAYLQYASIRYNAAAVGLMQVDPFSHQMLPVVYVRDTHTMVYESSCASGSCAVALFLAQTEDDGLYSYDFKEPGGMLNVVVTKRNHEVLSAKIGGTISMTEEFHTEI